MGCHIGGAVTASFTPFIASRIGWSFAFAFAAILAAAWGGALWLLVDPGRTHPSLSASLQPMATPSIPRGLKPMDGFEARK